MEELQQQLAATQAALEQANAYIKHLEARLENAARRDTTAAVETNAQPKLELRRVATRLAGLHAIDRAIINEHTIEELAETALAHMVQLVPCQHAIAMSIDLTSHTGYPLAIYSRNATNIPLHQAFSLTLLDIQVILTNRFVVYGNLANHPNRMMYQLYHEGVRTILTIGLKAEGRLIGVLNLHSNQPNAFTDEEREIALEIADLIAIAMHTATLRDTLDKHVAELEERITQRTENLANAKTNVEAILNSSSNAILLIDAEQGIQQSNATFTNMFGFTNVAVLGKPLTALLHHDYHVSLTSALRDLITYKSVQSLEAQAIHRYGTLFDVEIGLAPVKQSIYEYVQFVCTINDITERKKAAKALYDSEQRFRLLVNGVQDYGIYYLDPQGIVVSWNIGAERIKGYQESEIVGRSFEVFYAPEDRARGEPQRILVSAVEHGSYVGEGWRVRKDGSQFWASIVVTALHDDTGQLVGFSKITRDLTERKRAEEAARASENKYRALVETMHDGLTIFSADHQITYVNERFTMMLGYTAAELIGTRLDVYFDALNTQLLHSYLDNPQRPKSEVCAISITHKNGARLDVTVTSSPVLDTNNNPASIAIWTYVTVLAS